VNSYVQLVGNLTRDPKRTESARGDAVCKFDIAVSRMVKEGESTPSYYNITCFGTLAENTFQSLHQGTRVILEGSMEVRVVAREDGTKATFVNVIADSVGVELRFNQADVREGWRTADKPPERREDRSARQPTPSQRRQPEPVSSRNYQFDEKPF
jgi:single-strand DNA-binding protein